jgi:hypothetical protein
LPKGCRGVFEQPGYPRRESIHRSETACRKFDKNFLYDAAMMPQYMKNGLLCQEWQQGWYYHWLSLKFIRGRWCVEEAHTSTHPPAPYKKFTSVVNKKTRVIIPYHDR